MTGTETSRTPSVPPSPDADRHPFQEYNEHGNSCHHPGCTLTYEQHVGAHAEDCYCTGTCVDPACAALRKACE